MRHDRLWSLILAAASLSFAGWTPVRDTPQGWSGDLSLVPSDSSDESLAATSFAIPQDAAAPAVRATLRSAMDSVGSSVSFSTSVSGWSGARIFHVNLSLSSAQRHLADLSRRHVHLELSWSGSQTGAILPIVSNTVLNPVGSRQFGNRRTLARRAATLPALPAADRSTAVLEIGDVSKRDDRIVSRTADNGIFRLTGKDLRGIFGSLAGVSLSNISVYRGPRDTLPTVAAAAVTAPELQAVTIQRLKNSTADTIADNDEIRFYVEGTSVWIRDTTASCGTGWRLNVSPYSLSRRYLIALQPEGAASGQAVSAEIGTAVTGSSPVSYTSVPQTWRIEKHQYLSNAEMGSNLVELGGDAKTGTNWYWQAAVGSSATLQPDFDTLFATSDSACVELSLAPRATGRAATFSSMGLSLNGGTAVSSTKMDNRGFWTAGGLKDVGNAFTFRFDNDSSRLQGISVHVPARMRLHGGTVEFPAPIAGAVAINVTVPSGSVPTGYAIANGAIIRPATMVKISDTLYQLTDSAATLDTRYRVSTQAAMLSTSSSAYVSLSRWTPNSSAITDFSQESADSMLVIAPDSLVSGAKAYADYRSSESPRRKLPTKVARLEDIYLLYSGGSQDPTAIRDFLRWSRENLGTSHVLLWGNASYDQRNLTRAARLNAIPTWESGCAASDNYYGYLDSAEWGWNRSDRTLDIALGRLAINSASESTGWLAKLKTFEIPTAGQDPSWRNTSFLVADDYLIDNGGGRIDGIKAHGKQTEADAQQILSDRPWNFMTTLFMANYTENAQKQKPAVRSAIISQLNQGTALFNYIGHGAAYQLAHERVFDIAAINSLSNSSMPNLFFAAACAVARFDDISQASLATSLVNASGKGSVAAIAGMRATYTDANGKFNKEFYRILFATDSAAASRTIGEALLSARNNVNDFAPFTQVLTNQDAYALIGDPAMSFAPMHLPSTGAITIDSLPDTIPALYHLERTGHLFTTNPALVSFRLLDTSFIDTVTLLDYPKDSCPACTTVVHKNPTQILSTVISGTNGTFPLDVMVPAKLDFEQYGSFSIYALDLKTGLSAGYHKGGVFQHGTSTSSTTDSVGPTITFSPCDSSYSAGQAFSGTAKIPLPFCMLVSLTDSSGISSTTGPDEGVIVNVPDVLDTWRPALTSGTSYRAASFQMTIDTSKYKRGSDYQVSVLAHDQMGNYSRGSITLDIQNEGTAGLYDVFNRPNPVKHGSVTTFYFKVTDDPDSNSAIPSTLQASIRIHTLSGKLIKVLRVDLSQAGTFLPEAVWDLHDDYGNAVANGLYPYVVTLRIPGQNSTWKQIRKRGVVAVSK